MFVVLQPPKAFGIREACGGHAGLHAGGGDRVGRHEPVRQLEPVRDVPVLVGGDLDVSLPGLLGIRAERRNRKMSPPRSHRASAARCHAALLAASEPEVLRKGAKGLYLTASVGGKRRGPEVGHEVREPGDRAWSIDETNSKPPPPSKKQTRAAVAVAVVVGGSPAKGGELRRLPT